MKNREMVLSLATRLEQASEGQTINLEEAKICAEALRHNAFSLSDLQTGEIEKTPVFIDVLVNRAEPPRGGMFDLYVSRPFLDFELWALGLHFIVSLFPRMKR